MDTPLQYSSREKCWVLPGAFFLEYFCHHPETRAMSEFTEKYLYPAVANLAAEMDESIRRFSSTDVPIAR